MKLLLTIGFAFVAVVVFIIGLAPGEHFLSSPNTESHVLIGEARLATWITGLCEFILGAAVIAAWFRFFRRKPRNEK